MKCYLFFIHSCKNVLPVPGTILGNGDEQRAIWELGARNHEETPYLKICDGRYHYERNKEGNVGETLWNHWEHFETVGGGVRGVLSAEFEA